MTEMDTPRPRVGLLMGSANDWPIVQDAAATLKRFGVACEVRAISAHRTPEEAADYARTAADRGIGVIIAAAGGAAHLAGVLAAHTPLPVIGIPVEGGALNGLDALLSMVQMPAGIPVATVACGKSGPTNAGLLAVQILGTGDADLRRKYVEYKRSLHDKVIAADAQLQQDIAANA